MGGVDSTEEIEFVPVRSRFDSAVRLYQEAEMVQSVAGRLGGVCCLLLSDLEKRKEETDKVASLHRR